MFKKCKLKVVQQNHIFLLKTNNEKTTKFKLKVKLLEVKFVL